MHIYPFRPLIPPSNEAAETVTCPTHDALSLKQVQSKLAEHPHSFISVIRPDALNPTLPPHHPAHCHSAQAALSALTGAGVLVRETTPALYIYKLVSKTHVQHGVVATLPLIDYVDKRIKQHELTHSFKEAICTKLTNAISANTAPVFLTYQAEPTISDTVRAVVASEPPLFSLESEDRVSHVVYRVPPPHAAALVRAFAAHVPQAYIADGHHRAASAANVAQLRNNLRTATFPVVLFPHSELRVVSYNRVVRSLGQQSVPIFLQRVRAVADLSAMSVAPTHAPPRQGRVYMHVARRWYDVVLPDTCCVNDPDDVASRLDCAVLQRTILEPVLDIRDMRTDPRLQFVSGDVPISSVLHRTEAEHSAVTFVLRAVSVCDVMRVADVGQVMPPKSTCFEPKLRCGFFVHMIN